MAKQNKTEMVLVRFTPDDKQAIEKAASKEDMNTSEFIRAAVLAYMALTLDHHALRSALRGGIELLKDFEQEGRQQFFSGTKKVKA